MRKEKFIFAVLLLFCGSWLSEAKDIKDLPLKYRQWLQEEVVYIIGEKEKSVFLQLETDRERDVFIEAFWKQRDPTPNTLKNEFQEEHYRRIGYANQMFGRGAPGPGWRTDRGKVYIILGEPQQKQVYDNLSETVPVEIWFYQGIEALGMSDAFSVVFFKRDQAGDYILYSPVKDGPKSLLRFWEMTAGSDPLDISKAYSMLYEVSPEIARVSLSLISGQEALVSSPSLASDILLANISQYPQKKVNPEYAEKFLHYKGIVDVDYSANYIDSSVVCSIIPDPSGICFVHYAIEPKRLSVELLGNRYTTELELNGKVSDSAGKTIFQFDRKIPLSLSEDEVNSLKSRPFSLQGLFPLVEGSYNLSFILKNFASKEFTTAEKNIVVFPYSPTVALGPLLLGYGVKKEHDPKSKKAFEVQGEQIFVSPMNQFAPNETLHVLFQIFGSEKEKSRCQDVKFAFLNEPNELAKTKTSAIKDYHDEGIVHEVFDLREFKSANYELIVSVSDKDGKEILAGSARLSVSSLLSIPRPLVYFDPSPPAGAGVYSFVIGGQYFNKGNIEKAQLFLSEAYKKDSNSQLFALGYARVLFAQKKFKDLVPLLEPFQAAQKIDPEVLELLGESYKALGVYGKALDSLRNYLSSFGLKLSVLNSVGDCYYALGDNENALVTWEKSLQINPNQEDIKKAVATLKEKR
jgi:GWxTD domain-containing protein